MVKNGMTVAVVEKRSVPLVTVLLLVKKGASSEEPSKAGLANLTASMLTKGTTTRTATQIAEEIEFLGGSINSGATWNSSNVAVTVTSDKLEQAVSILADVVLNPAFKQEELDLLRSQALDGLTYNLKQPGFLATYVASKFSFSEHPAEGTPASLAGITREDVVGFHRTHFDPRNTVLIFTGDVTSAKASSLAEKVFGGWKSGANASGAKATASTAKGGAAASAPLFKRLLVIDLPNSGQASVNFVKPVSTGRTQGSKAYYPASVLNSLLGGGYSSRLNQEIRIKRGLSYGAGSSFAWRSATTNFGTRTQTKNESAGEVAELVLADLYGFGLPTAELNAYAGSVNAVTDAQIREFAKSYLVGGDIIIVGDYAKFKDDIAKRFPGVAVDVIKASELDLSTATLRKQ
jgi:zinc protease